MEVTHSNKNSRDKKFKSASLACKHWTRLEGNQSKKNSSFLRINYNTKGFIVQALPTNIKPSWKCLTATKTVGFYELIIATKSLIVQAWPANIGPGWKRQTNNKNSRFLELIIALKMFNSSGLAYKCK